MDDWIEIWQFLPTRILKILNISFYVFSCSAKERGWVVVVDARHCPYRVVKPSISTVRAALGNIRTLYVIRPDGFWGQQRVDCRKSEVDTQVSKELKALGLEIFFNINYLKYYHLLYQISVIFSITLTK